MRYLFLFLSATLLIACNSTKGIKTEADENLNQTVPYDDSVMLLGKVNRTGLQMDAFSDWYGPGYDSYKSDAEVMQELKPLMKDIDILVFMGTWCEDSHEEVPNFFKVLDELNFDESRVTMYAVDEEKVEPKKEVEEHGIIQVPTFIFFKDGKEINRIVEYNLRSIERDMLDILSGKNYKNPYWDF